MSATAPPASRQLFVERDALLRSSWQRSTEAFFTRLGRFLKDPGLYDEVRDLLAALLDVIERPGVPGDAQAGLGDAHLAKVVSQLRHIQARESIGTTEMVFFLFSVKDILESALSPAREARSRDAAGKQASGPEFSGSEISAPAASGDGNALPAEQAQSMARVSSLLNRLGLVLFESELRARKDTGFHEGELAMEYALLYERARRLAITDQLTGLHNFGYFRDRLREEKARAERYLRLLSLIIFDIDHFKKYNDTHGHPAGNEVLVTIARLLGDNVREVDIVARYGGEEFVVVLPEATRREATRMAERIAETIARTSFPHMHTQPFGRITLSAGVATYPVDASDEEQLIRRADESLYAAKAQGRNRVVWYEPPHRERLVFRAHRPLRTVSLVGSFNNWDEDYDFMYPIAPDTYEFVISLNPGTYQYKFVLDGSEWIPDPACPERCPDGLGGENSVLRVRG